MEEKSASQCKVNTRTPERHKGAAPTPTSAAYKGSYVNDILGACPEKSKSEAMPSPPANERLVEISVPLAGC
jgi:hypothetical protein